MTILKFMGLLLKFLHSASVKEKASKCGSGVLERLRNQQAKEKNHMPLYEIM